MKLQIPDVRQTLKHLMLVKSSFDSRTETISTWISVHRKSIESNRGLIESRREEDHIAILAILIPDLLMRGMKGERGEKLRRAFRKAIRSKADLAENKYRKLLAAASYRFVDDGLTVMSASVAYFRDNLKWNWKAYFDEARRHSGSNFQEDPLLKIKGLKFKVRDLALSNFDPGYAAFDIHVVRVVARTGLLAHGWASTACGKYNFGTNQGDQDNYMFLHSLFLRLSELSGDYSPVDLDRIFWHFGRACCTSTPACSRCPIKGICLTGKQRTKSC